MKIRLTALNLVLVLLLFNFNTHLYSQATLVYVCHDGETICLAIAEVESHLDHGDQLGQCRTTLQKASALEDREVKSQGISSLKVYPNPFKDATIFEFQAKEKGKIALTIYSLTGVEMESLFEGIVEKDGRRTLEFHRKALPPGIYFYKLSTPYGVFGGKLMIVE